MDYHHVVEAAGAIALGLVFYSYTWRWFDAAESPRRARWRPVVTGVVFGLLAILMTKSRIEVGDGRFIDPRLIPLALVTLVEGSVAGAIAGTTPAAYRLGLGGGGAFAGALGIVATVGAAAAVRAWARREGGVGFRHSLALAIVVYAITWGTFLILGRRGAALFAPVWLHTLVLYVVGIGLVARLFGDVVAGRAARAARRGAPPPRAGGLLAAPPPPQIKKPPPPPPRRGGPAPPPPAPRREGAQRV